MLLNFMKMESAVKNIIKYCGNVRKGIADVVIRISNATVSTFVYFEFDENSLYTILCTYVQIVRLAILY